jgi:hypothetical protein
MKRNWQYFDGFVHSPHNMGHESKIFCKFLRSLRSIRRSVAEKGIYEFVERISRLADPFLFRASGCVNKTRGGSYRIDRGCLGKNALRSIKLR